MFRMIPLLLATILMSGCDGGSTPADNEGQTNEVAWLLDKKPSDVLTIREAKEKTKFSQEIALRGRIGGRASALESHTPVFVMIDDEGLKKCDASRCKTPWDYCCESQDTLAERIATIHLVGNSNAQLDPTGGGVLSANDEIIVVGKVGPRPDPKVLTLTATGVYRMP